MLGSSMPSSPTRVIAGPDKTATILADDIFKYLFLNENDRIPIQISPKFVSRSSIDNKPALV